MMPDISRQCEGDVQEELDFIARMSRVLLDAEDMDSILKEILHDLSEHQSYKRSMIGLFNRKGRFNSG